MKKLLFVLATAVLLFLTACDGSFVDPGMMDMIGVGGGGGGGGGKAPAVPKNVKATAKSSSSIEITWNAVSGADEYNVYRSTSATGSYSYVGYTSSTSYTNTGLSADTTYYYKVSAENDYGESSQSSFVSATTSSTSGGGSGSKPATPTGVTATAQSSSSISISWSSVSGASSYNVYRSSSASGNYSRIKNVNSTSYTDTGLSANTTYYYKVTAENSNGESAQSSYVSATTSSTGGGGDKKAELKGTWLKDGGKNQETIDYPGYGGSNDLLYLRADSAGVALYYGQLVSYDGTTVKVGDSKDVYQPITFTAKITNGKLTVSGIQPIVVPGNMWVEGYTADFNGTYTKQ